MTPAGSPTQAGTENRGASSPHRTICVLDLINTDKSAKELLHHRVAQVNRTGRYVNDICCGSGEYVARLRAEGHTVQVVDTPRGLSPLRLLVAIWRTYRLLRREAYDIIHTHGSVIWLIGAMAAFLARTPVVVAQVHGFHHHDNMKPLPRALHVRFQWFLALLSDVLAFQNQADLDEGLRSRIVPARKSVLIGNGVQLDSFPLGDPPDNDPPTILCVARFEPVKNHGMVLEAARLLKRRGVRFVLNLVGDGELAPECQAWVGDHGLDDVVRFLGYRDDVPKLTAAADVCVLTSIKEGLPRAIIEAAACGRPMVATDVLGNRDVIVNGETGFLVPLNDATALADRLQALLADKSLRRQIGQTGRQYALEHFNERTVTERIIDLYDRISRQMDRGSRARGEGRQVDR